MTHKADAIQLNVPSQFLMTDDYCEYGECE